MCRLELLIASILLPKILASPIKMCDEFESFSCDIGSLAEEHAHPLQWTRCIPKEKICDGFKDCFSGIDELDCSTSCLPTESKCRNGVCISKDYICDGDQDCADGEDELNCSTVSPKDTEITPSTASTITLNPKTVSIAIFWVVVVFLFSALLLCIWRRKSVEEVRVVETIESYPPPPSYRDSLTIVDFFPSSNVYPSVTPSN